MSFASEAAFTAPPLGRPFDFSKARRIARDILVDLRSGSGVVYRKTTAFAALLATPLFKMEEYCGTDFDLATHPIPVRASKKRERRGFYDHVGTAMAGATFMAALFAPTNFTTRTHIQDYEPDFTIVSQSDATQTEAVPTYPVMYSEEWQESRARLLAAYAARRASMHPVEAAPVYEAAQQDVGGVQVTSFMSPEEHVDY